MSVGNGFAEFFHAGLGRLCLDKHKLSQVRQGLQLTQTCVGYLAAAEGQFVQAGHMRYSGHTLVGDLGRHETQFVELWQTLERFEPSVGDFCVPQVQRLQSLHPGNAGDSGIGNPGVMQVEFPQIGKLRQLSQIGVRDLCLMEIDGDNRARRVESHVVGDVAARFLDLQRDAVLSGL